MPRTIVPRVDCRSLEIVVAAVSRQIWRVVMAVRHDEDVVDAHLAGRQSYMPASVDTSCALDALAEMEMRTHPEMVDVAFEIALHLLPLREIGISRRHREIGELIEPARRVHIERRPNRGIFTLGIESPD